MRTACVGLLVVVLSIVCSASQQGAGTAASGETFVGTWSGTWAASGSGGEFELVLEKTADGTVGGKVSVTGEPTYKATFKSLSFDGNKMTAAYDFPPDESGEVLLTATFVEKKGDGTWALRAKGTTADIATGTWTVTKK
jgi:hypothetical protein